MVGGTGTVGRHVVAAARARGHTVVVLSRASGVDVTTGVGVPEALAGIETVIDATNLYASSTERVRRLFQEATDTLLQAEHRSGVGHHVVVSIVGIDGIDASYYAGKLAQERAVAAGAVPYTIARAAQFHEFAGQMLARTEGPIVVLPKALIRPVAAREVGEHLVRVAEGGPVGRASDLVGPRDERLAELARRQLAHDRARRTVIELRIPGVFGAGLASGVLRGAQPRLEGQITFAEWLTSEDHHR